MLLSVKLTKLAEKENPSNADITICKQGVKYLITTNNYIKLFHIHLLHVKSILANDIDTVLKSWNLLAIKGEDLKTFLVNVLENDFINTCWSWVQVLDLASEKQELRESCTVILELDDIVALGSNGKLKGMFFSR